MGAKRIERHPLHEPEDCFRRVRADAERSQLRGRDVAWLSLDLVDHTKDTGQLLLSDAKALEQGAQETAVADTCTDVFG